MRKRFLSILLALCMVLTLLPGTAFAASGHHPFTDVADTDWYNSAVQYVYEHGMMSGTSSTKFSPDIATSRGMIVTILHRLEGTPSATGMTFTDVAAGEYYTNAVTWASANNIVNGYSSSTFGPDDPITREQLAAILYRYAQYKGYDTTITGSATAFLDGGQVSSYAVDAASWAVGVGLLQGIGNNMLSPAGGATRAQTATILMRFCENVATQGTPPDIEISEDEIYTKTPDEGHIKDGTYELDGESTEGLYVDNQIVVVAKNGVKRSQIDELVKQYEGTIVGQIGAVGYYQVEFASSMTGTELSKIARKVSNSMLVEDAFINFVLEYENQSTDWEQTYLPDDFDDIAKTSQQNRETFWNQDMGYIGHLRVCNVPQAWQIVKNSNPNPSIKMGLIDDAVAVHEDLKLIAGYYRNDKYQPDVVATAAPLESSEHGTHVAGIMGAIGNNGKGISGVALNAELVSVSRRIKDGKKSCLVDFASNAADYGRLIQEGCKVINVSLGFYKSDLLLSDALKELGMKLSAEKEAKKLEKELLKYIDQKYPFVIVVAAGNYGEDDHNTLYNSGLAYITDSRLKDRIIVVGNAALLWGASDENGNRLFSAVRHTTSSYKGNRVDVMAPGMSIWSTISYRSDTKHYSNTDSTGKSMTGTSMASPFVAGLAGLIWEVNPNLSPEQVKAIIVATADIDVSDSDAKMVNAEAAVSRAAAALTSKIELRFIDSSTNNHLACSTVNAYYSDYSYEGYGGTIVGTIAKLDLLHILSNESGYSETAEDTYLGYGQYEIVFSAEDYQDKTVQITADSPTKEITIMMTPSNGNASEYVESYKDILRQYPEYSDESWGKEYTEYILYDIDKNGIPELIIRSNVWNYAVYTFDGRNSVLCGEISASYFGSYAELYEYDGNGIVIHYGGMGPMRVESVDTQQLIDNVLTEGISIGSTEDMSFDELYSMLGTYTLLNNFYRINDYTPFIE